MITNIIKRQYQNISLLGAYSWLEFLKQFVSFPFDYYLRNGRSSFPLNITLALTLRCNARCSMCALKEVLYSDGKELSLDQYRDFIDSCVKMRPGFVLYGGEPFLRPDAIDIIRIIKKHGLSCGVFTNGLPLNKDMLKEIAGLRMNFVVFSLYGPKEIHDKITGINGAYDKAMENISFLKNHRKNTKVIIHCAVSKDNIRYLDRVSDISICDSVRFGHLTFITEDRKKDAADKLGEIFPGEAVRLESHIFNPEPETSRLFTDALIKLKSKKSIPFTPELNNQEIAGWYSHEFKTKRKCLFIWRGVFIAPNGDVYPCMGNFYYKMGNILSEDLAKIWNNDKFIRLRTILNKGLLPACSRCCRL